MPPVTRSQSQKDQELRQSMSRRSERSSRLERSSQGHHSSSSTHDDGSDLEELMSVLSMFEPSVLTRAELADQAQPVATRPNQDPLSRTRSEIYRTVTTIIARFARRHLSLAREIIAAVPESYRSLDEVIRSVDRDFEQHGNYLRQVERSPASRQEPWLDTEIFLDTLRVYYNRTEAIREREGHDRTCNELALCVFLRILGRFSTFSQYRVNMQLYLPAIRALVEQVAVQESSLLRQHRNSRRVIVNQFQTLLTPSQYEQAEIGLLWTA